MPSRLYPSLPTRALAILAAALLFGGARSTPLRAAEGETSKSLPPAAQKSIDYARDIQPLLAARCAECHGEKKQESRFRLDRREVLLRGGSSGEPAIVAGHSEQSRLIKFVARLDPDTVMPPEGKPLSDEQVALLRAWIDQGAKMPEIAAPASAAQHLWSLKPVKPAVPPAITDRWIATPVDAFLLEKLHSRGLAPSPPADRISLIRRASLDTIGLPPTPEEIERFVADRDPKAYEHLVDHLLDSPHYGERWARHWLDVIRFADTDGYETNWERPNAYRFRDYLIRAFNEDRPWDRMVVEQLAGDAVGEDAATGFLVGGGVDRVTSPNELLTRTQRQDELADMIGTTGTALMGLTIGCARCHDHKFDPIPQRDYYAMQAVFAGVRHEERPLRFADGKPFDESSVAAFRGKHPPVNARFNEERFGPTLARAVRLTVTATNDGLEPCIDEIEIYESSAKDGGRNVALAAAGATAISSGNFQGNARHKLEHINDGKFGNDRSWISNERGRGWVQINLPRGVVVDRVVWQRDRESRFADRLPIGYKIELLGEAGGWSEVASSADRVPYRTEMPAAMVYGGRFVQPGATYRLNRGDPMQPREVVAADALTALKATLGSLNQKVDAPEQERRLALARWIARPDNPLTARVIVNRLWHYHFGTGIVASPSDFGHMGAPPSHPELLDWLAAELMRGGWRLKHVHRLILLSNAYRQSSAPNPQGLAADATDHLLWLFPPRRLEAEAIRDSILAASGALDLTMYGPGFSAFEPNTNYVRIYKPKETWGPAEFRRMVYMNKIRREPDGVFGAFDSPDAGQVCPRRSRSTTPLQALNLLNSSFLVQQSDILAQRVEKEAKASVPARIERAFELTLGRRPSAEEASAGARLVERHGLQSLCRALYNANEFSFLP